MTHDDAPWEKENGKMSSEPQPPLTAPGSVPVPPALGCAGQALPLAPALAGMRGRWEGREPVFCNTPASPREAGSVSPPWAENH